MTHPELRDLLALYALGALDSEASAELGLHLEGCATCREELAELEDASAALALAAEPVEPSAQVTRRILATSPPRLAPVRRLPVRGRFRLRLRRLAIGAAVAAAVILAVSEVTLLRRLDRAHRMLS